MRLRTRSLVLSVTGATLLAIAVIFYREMRSSSEAHSRMQRMKVCISWLISDPGVAHPAIRIDANGNALYSWRYHSYVLMSQKSLVANDVRQRLEYSWADQNNRAIREAVGPWEFCQSGKRTACVLGVVGRDTAFDPSKFPTWLTLTEDQLILVEGEIPGLHWMAPGDLEVDQIPTSAKTLDDLGIRHLASDGVYVAFADGDVWMISTQTPLAKLRLFMTAANASQHDRFKELGTYRVDSLAN